MALIPLEQADPIRYKTWLESTQQPTANLAQTVASTGAAGASAAHSVQETINAQLTQKIEQQKIDQQNFLKATKAAFDKSKSGDYVNPSVYNAQKAAAGALGIDSNSFDSNFEKSYTDPNSIQYNTDIGRTNQEALGETKRQIQGILSSFNSVPDYQKGNITGASEQTIPLIAKMLAPEAYAYENARQGLAANIKGIAGAGTGSGVRVTQTELNNWANLIPSVKNSDAVNNKNLQQLDSLIKAKFNTDIGLDPQYLPKNGNNKPSVEGLVQNAGSNAKDILNGILNIPAQAVENQNKYGSMGQSILSGQGPGRQLLLGSTAPIVPAAQEANQALGEPLKGGDVLSRILQRAYDKPVTTGMDIATVLPFLKGAGNGGVPINPEVSSNPELAMAQNSPQVSPTQTTSLTPVPSEVKMPGPIQKILNPKSINNAAAKLRTNALDAAEAAGNTVSGDNVVSALNDWAKSAKMGNISEVPKIQEALDSAKSLYGGQNLTPKQVAEAYASADNGFTANGVPKSPTQALIDRGLRDVLSKQLEKAAPGWEDSTKMFAKGYQFQKSPTGKIVQNLPKIATNVALHSVGLGIVGKLLGL